MRIVERIFELSYIFFPPIKIFLVHFIHLRYSPLFLIFSILRRVFTIARSTYHYDARLSARASRSRALTYRAVSAAVRALSAPLCNATLYCKQAFLRISLREIVCGSNKMCGADVETMAG